MIKKNSTRKDLSNKIYQKLGFSKNLSSIIVDDFFESLTTELIKTKKVKITSFGTFKVVDKSERIGRNPKTKESKIISQRNVVSFKPSNEFKNYINKNEKNK